LKHVKINAFVVIKIVAPFTGAWIETLGLR